jgi:hypothetical protein
MSLHDDERLLAAVAAALGETIALVLSRGFHIDSRSAGYELTCDPGLGGFAERGTRARSGSNSNSCSTCRVPHVFRKRNKERCSPPFSPGENTFTARNKIPPRGKELPQVFPEKTASGSRGDVRSDVSAREDTGSPSPAAPDALADLVARLRTLPPETLAALKALFGGEPPPV